MIEVEQTVKHSDEQVNTRKEIQTAPTENINNRDNNTVQQNKEEWWKGAALTHFGGLSYILTYREKDVQK